MTQRLVHRPARTGSEPVDLAPIQLHPPPTLPDPGAGAQGVLQILMPILGGAGSLIMIVANRNPVMLIAGGIMLVATVLGGVGLFVAQRTGAPSGPPTSAAAIWTIWTASEATWRQPSRSTGPSRCATIPDPTLLVQLVTRPGHGCGRGARTTPTS